MKQPIASLLLGLLFLPLEAGFAEKVASGADSSDMGTTKPATIAHRILKLDAQVKPVTDAMTGLLDAVIADACQEIGKVRRKGNGRWDRVYAEKVLRRIDETLIRHGFVYPASGGVDQLADALTSFQMSAAQRPWFVSHPANARRGAMIAERFPGPFFALDCDTASFIYLGVAERLNLPLHLVVIPSLNRRAGHSFVRWREGRHYLNWETMHGLVRSDADYIHEWNVRSAQITAGAALVDLTADQVLGCAHHLLAVQHERRKDSERSLQELSTALALYPQSLDARREFAWVMATGSGVQVRDNAAAISNALHVVRLADDSDARDTLAAAYASAGMFELAVKEERAAIADGATPDGSRLGYRQRLQLYERRMPYRRP